MRLVYFRVSDRDQSIEAQRAELRQPADREFCDKVSGLIPFAERPGGAELLRQVRAGDVVYVAAVDRLGRDSIDIQQTVRRLLSGGVGVEIEGVGALSGDAGAIVLAVLAQLAEADRNRIVARTAAGRRAAKEAMERTGRTHRGKISAGGRPYAGSPEAILAWKAAKGASFAETAAHFGLGASTVKRYAKLAREAAGAPSTIDAGA